MLETLLVCLFYKEQTCQIVHTDKEQEGNMGKKKRNLLNVPHTVMQLVNTPFPFSMLGFYADFLITNLKVIENNDKG